jgi:hypothetical protein
VGPSGTFALLECHHRLTYSVPEEDEQVRMERNSMLRRVRSSAQVKRVAADEVCSFSLINYKVGNSAALTADSDAYKSVNCYYYLGVCACSGSEAMSRSPSDTAAKNPAHVRYMAVLINVLITLDAGVIGRFSDRL